MASHPCSSFPRRRESSFFLAFGVVSFSCLALSAKRQEKCWIPAYARMTIILKLGRPIRTITNALQASTPAPILASPAPLLRYQPHHSRRGAAIPWHKFSGRANCATMSKAPPPRCQMSIATAATERIQPIPTSDFASAPARAIPRLRRRSDSRRDRQAPIAARAQRLNARHCPQVALRRAAITNSPARRWWLKSRPWTNYSRRRPDRA